MSVQNGKRVSTLFNLLIFILICMWGCTSSHQVLKYETAVNSSENIIPGIEPEESAQKILILVRGKGIEPETGTPMQKKFLAERAAVLDGYRRLSERLAGMAINTQTHSGRSELSRDDVMTETRAYLQGAQIGAVTYHEGFATVDIKLYIKPREARFITQKSYY